MANRIALVLCLILFCVIAAASAQETITVTTYYPSPMGSYYELQAQRLGVGDIDNDGNFTSADVPTVDGGAAIRGPVGIGKNMIPSGAANETTVAIRSPASAGAAFAFTVQNSGNQALFYVQDNGFIGVGLSAPSVALDVSGDIEYTGDITDVSDGRLKENVAGIDEPISKIQGINGVYFNMIGSKKRELGVVAQDVQKVLPEAVSVVDPEKGYLGVDYTDLVPVLVEAVKAQQKEIDSLKSEIAGLKAR